jgi:hypothetical protein
MTDHTLLSLAFAVFAIAGFIIGRLSKADAIAERDEQLADLRTAYEALRAKYEALTDRDEKGRFVRREP